MPTVQLKARDVEWMLSEARDGLVGDVGLSFLGQVVRWAEGGERRAESGEWMLTMRGEGRYHDMVDWSRSKRC
jgi:hypothetical protein